MKLTSLWATCSLLKYTDCILVICAITIFLIYLKKYCCEASNSTKKRKSVATLFINLIMLTFTRKIRSFTINITTLNNSWTSEIRILL